MIENMHNIKEDYFQDRVYDVCIIGSGFAGITSALKLDKKLSILLLEAGDLEYTQESQDMYKGTNTGHVYYDLDACRTRFFGGTSNYWGGWSVPFDKEVFERRLIKNSEWPIKKSDLDPYLDETYTMFGFKKSMYQEYLCKGNAEKYRYFKPYKIAVAKQDYYTTKHKLDINNANNIECYYNANLIDMKMNKSLNNISYAYIKDYENRQYKVKSKIFILATGGIENARLMLNFNKECKAGIGNGNNLVGKYFTEHLHYNVGQFILNDKTTSYFNQVHRMKLFHTNISLEERENILACTIELHNKEKEFKKDYNSRLKEIVRNLICSSETLQDIANNVRNRKLFCYPDDIDDTNGIIRVQSEQQLNYNSTIELNKEKDILGLRKINLNWSLNTIDKKTIKRSMLSFGSEFAELDIGRIKLDKWLLDSSNDLPGEPHRIGGPHHMCTTKMGFTEKDGVVDLNQKVFGIDNLYIAGSSVFSTAGSVNPTFTIVQMTIRLADYLNKKVFSL